MPQHGPRTVGTHRLQPGLESFIEGLGIGTGCARHPLIDPGTAPADGNEPDGHIEFRGQFVAQARPGSTTVARGDRLRIARMTPRRSVERGNSLVLGLQLSLAMIGRVRLPRRDEDLAHADPFDFGIADFGFAVQRANFDVVPAAFHRQGTRKRAARGSGVDRNPAGRRSAKSVAGNSPCLDRGDRRVDVKHTFDLDVRFVLLVSLNNLLSGWIGKADDALLDQDEHVGNLVLIAVPCKRPVGMGTGSRVIAYSNIVSVTVSP